jgi:hypothetical protein
MRKLTRILMLLIMGVMVSAGAFSQITTSGMNGKVTGPDGASLPAATVVATHVPTGTVFGAITDAGGFFRLPNMDVGGPYTVKVTFVGYESWTKENIYLTLGQTNKVDVALKSTEVKLGEVAVVGKRSGVNVFDGNRTGAQTFIPLEKLDVMPTISRDLTDFTRLTPQASVDDNGAINIAGVNNRYNSLMIDGGAQNDVFGLAASGVNGGQTGGSPISMDAIEQFMVTLAPYDIRNSGFAGASINAVTRRGTNQVTGSVYGFYRNEKLSGKTPYAILNTEGLTKDSIESLRKPLADFTAITSGFRVGGPIIKNKLFFFLNAEVQRDQTPQPFVYSEYTGKSTEADVNALSDYLVSKYGYDPGGFIDNTKELQSNKLMARLDWNINENHKLMLRHSYTNHKSLGPSRSTGGAINFYNAGVYFPSTTNSTTAELKSNFDNMSNSLMVVYTDVNDDRDPMGADFPAVQILDGKGTINFGSEQFSTGNSLVQKSLVLTDNLSIYKGKHTITIGTSNEFAHVYNLFVRQNYGYYRFNSIADFYNNKAFSYARYYSLVDDITGDGSMAAANFNMLQLGVYAQDEFQASDRFKLTFGVRADMPIFMTQPVTDTLFNSVTIPKLEAAGWDMQGAKAGQMPKSQILFSPRVGFNWDLSGDESAQLRGGVGVFTSRLPLVWPGGSYTNSGVIVGGFTANKDSIGFIPEYDKQYEATDLGSKVRVPSGQMDLFAANFKYPQVFRANLGFDKKLPWGIIGTVEAIFTKTLNNVTYLNLNYNPTPKNNLTGADTREYYDNSKKIDATYDRIILGVNTDKGYTYNFTVSLDKPFANGFAANVAYTFGRALALNDATSSQNSSQWRYMEYVNGLNNLDLSISDFDLGHRVLAYVSYQIEYLKHASTTISIFYNGQSGMPYSYIYDDYNSKVNGGRGINGWAGENEGAMMFIPAAKDQIVFADAATADAQWEALNTFIENDKYLSQHRGEYAARNGARTPFEHMIDLKIAQDFFVMAGSTKHKLQLTFDVFNLANLLNPAWGPKYYAYVNTMQLVTFKGFAADGTTPTFEFKKPNSIYSVDDSGIRASRWMAQIGLRYSF